MVSFVDYNAVVPTIEGSSTQSFERTYVSGDGRSLEGIRPHFAQRGRRDYEDGRVLARDRSGYESLSHTDVVA
jgi:hypothetical protein